MGTGLRTGILFLFLSNHVFQQNGDLNVVYMSDIGNSIICIFIRN